MMKRIQETVMTSEASVVKNKGFITEAYEWDEDEVSSDDNEMVEVKVIMALAEENDDVSKKGAKNSEWVKISIRKGISEQIPSQKRRIMGVDQLTKDPSNSKQKDLVFVKSLDDDTKVTIPGVERPWLSEAEGFILPNHDTGRILPSESQKNTTDSLVVVTDSSATDYDSTNESLVYSIPLHPLKKLDGAEPISGPKTIKSILRSKSTFKAGDGSFIVTSFKLQLQKFTQLLLRLKSMGRMSSRPNIPRPSKRFFPPCIHCVGIDHLSNECLYYPICEALQAKKAEALKSIRAKPSNANRSKTPTKSGCSRHMTGVKSYLHRYMEQPEPKVVLGDDSTCITEGYGSIKCSGIVFIKKRGTSFNSNKKIVMIAPRVRDVFVLDMTLSAQESCFFAKVSENLNWIWHKRLAHLKFKTINKLAKQNLVIGLPSLVYSKDKPCSSCEKGKHHRASFKTKQTYSIKKCLHLLHMDLFRPVTPRSFNHEKHTLVIVDEYSRYTWKDIHLMNIFILMNLLKDQNDQPVQNDEILNDDHSEHSNHTNNEQIIDSLLNTKDIKTSEHLSSSNTEDTSEQNTTIPSPPLPVPLMVTPAPQDRWSQDKHIDLINIIGNPRARMLTRAMAKTLSVASAHECLFVDFLSEEEPKKVFRNKRDETGIVIKNKARLIAQGYNQQEGIDYDKTFTPVVRLEVIRNFLAFATYMNFIVYQMDVKSAFLNGKLKEQVYVKQPLGFESNEFPNHVCKLNKALYGLKQAPRACIEANPKESHLIVVKRIFRYLKDVPVDSKAPKYSSPTEKVPQGKNPGARKTKSSSAMDISPSHPSSPTPVFGEMHKKAQQAAGGPTSLGDTSEDGARPQLSSVDFTAEVDSGISAPKDSIP
nr:retrovirus-related Pol polyprotein from transposon TNT 1-94 [Tanacetum cinerariifolium]